MSWIAAHISWTIADRNKADRLISLESDGFSTWRLLGEIEIQVTLKKDVPPRWKSFAGINERYLLDHAFVPKMYTVRLEKGTFAPYAELMMRRIRTPSRYGLRLVFDRSPYPPLQEWRVTGGAEANKVWEWRIFCARELPEAGADAVQIDTPEDCDRPRGCIVC